MSYWRGGGRGRQDDQPPFEVGTSGSKYPKQPQRSGGTVPRGGGGAIRSAGRAPAYASIAQLCQHYTIKGSCKFADRCKFAHALRMIGLQVEAHTRPIISAAAGPVVISPDGKLTFELFTGDDKGALKRWTAWSDSPVSSPVPAVAFSSLFPADAIAPGSPPPTAANKLPRFELTLETTMNMPSKICKILLTADCLICGLGDGTIQGFHKSTGNAFSLPGHAGAVQAIEIVDTILVTGDSKGVLRFWRPQIDQMGNPGFVAEHQVDLAWPITCFRSVTTASGRLLLFVGGLSRTKVLDLHSMTWAPTDAETGIPDSLCVSLVAFGEDVLSAYYKGGICVVSSEGKITHQTANPHKNTIVSSTGVMSQDAPHLLVGLREGEMIAFKLPSFSVEWHFKPHDEDIRQLLTVEGGPLNLFVTTSADKAIALWTLKSDAR